MEDRYIELRELAQQNKAWVGTPKKVSVSDDVLKAFLERAKVAQNGINLFQQLNNELKGLEAEVKKITTAEQEKMMNEKIAIVVNKGKDAAEQTKAILDLLNKEAEKNKEEFPKEPETRAMASQVRALTSQFASVLKDNQAIQYILQSQIRERIKRQVRIIDNTLSPEEVDNISENPNAFQQLMEVKTLGKAHLRMYYKVEDIMEKYQGIMKLEKSIEYILELLHDISFLVEKQGEMLDSIEKDLEKAENYVKKANRVLEKEKKDHKKRRARYCCILLIVIIIGGVVAVPIINSVS